MTHPFHPLSGRDFEFVAHRQNWGEDRVHLHDENGDLFSLPAGWTDVVAQDLFVVIAAGLYEGEYAALSISPAPPCSRRMAGCSSRVSPDFRFLTTTVSTRLPPLNSCAAKECTYSPSSAAAC